MITNRLASIRQKKTSTKSNQDSCLGISEETLNQEMVRVWNDPQG